MTGPTLAVDYAPVTATAAQAASRELAVSSGAVRNQWLRDTADRLRRKTDELLSENRRDLQQAVEFGLTAAMVDRLTLTPERVEAMAAGLEQIADLPDPVGEVIDGSVRPNGLSLTRVRVPLGVVFFVYESRPNVTIDAAALCVKSGNAVILRGGKEAFFTNHALHRVVADSLDAAGLPPTAVQLVESTDRELVGRFLALGELIDVAIPRGGRSLIERVTQEAQMPVLKHFDGICHVYADAGANPDMASRIILNSKCQRPGVCNAAETLLVHADLAPAWLPQIGADLVAAGVEIRGCARCCDLIPESTPATDEDYATEHLSLVLSVRVVDDIEAAIEHIRRFGSGHTEAIVTDDRQMARMFTARVDAAAVMVNASTRFNDGGEFGLGAEIGISTDKFHARGPCGLRELTSYKYIVEGDGQVR